MCSTVGKWNLYKSKRQRPWGQDLRLGVHSMQLILIDGINLAIAHHRFNQRHDSFGHLPVYVEWKVNVEPLCIPTDSCSGLQSKQILPNPGTHCRGQSGPRNTSDTVIACDSTG